MKKRLLSLFLTLAMLLPFCPVMSISANAEAVTGTETFAVNMAWNETADGTEVSLDGMVFTYGVNAFNSIVAALAAMTADTTTLLIAGSENCYDYDYVYSNSKNRPVLKQSLTIRAVNTTTNPVIIPYLESAQGTTVTFSGNFNVTGLKKTKSTYYGKVILTPDTLFTIGKDLIVEFKDSIEVNQATLSNYGKLYFIPTTTFEAVFTNARLTNAYYLYVGDKTDSTKDCSVTLTDSVFEQTATVAQTQIYNGSSFTVTRGSVTTVSGAKITSKGALTCDSVSPCNLAGGLSSSGNTCFTNIEEVYIRNFHNLGASGRVTVKNSLIRLTGRNSVMDSAITTLDKDSRIYLNYTDDTATPDPECRVCWSHDEYVSPTMIYGVFSLIYFDMTDADQPSYLLEELGKTELRMTMAVYSDVYSHQGTFLMEGKENGYFLKVIDNDLYAVKEDYLCFTAEEDSSVTANFASGSASYRVSTDGGESWGSWTDCNAAGTPTVISLDKNDMVQMRGDNVITDEDHHFSMAGKISASGSVTSLIDGVGSCYAVLPEACFAYMFYQCDDLIVPPELTAVTLSASCYQYMFAGCTSLTSAPILSARHLVDSCYAHMFEGCTSLTVTAGWVWENYQDNKDYDWAFPDRGDEAHVNSLTDMTKGAAAIEASATFDGTVIPEVLPRKNDSRFTTYFNVIPVPVKAVGVSEPGAETYYLTLQEAVAACTGASEDPVTITLQIDVNEQITVNEGQNIILDLNGKTLSYEGNAVINHGQLTIEDSDESRLGTVRSTNAANALTADGGSITVLSGNYDGGLATANAGSITVADGRFTVDPTDYVVSGFQANSISKAPYSYEIGFIPVAKTVGAVETNYPSLKDAVDACTGSSESAVAVTLLKDSNEQITISEEQNIILDLNGKTLSYEDNTLTNHGKLTIVDNSQAKTGKIVTAASSGNSIINEGASIRFCHTITLSDSDQWINKKASNTLYPSVSWDLTNGLDSYACIENFQYYINSDTTTQYIIVSDSQPFGNYVIAAGDMSDFVGKDSFVLTGAAGEEDESLLIGDTVLYNGVNYELIPDTNAGKLVLSVFPDLGVFVDNDFNGHWFKNGDTVTITGTYISDEEPMITVNGNAAEVDHDAKTWSYTWSSAPADTDGTDITVTISYGAANEETIYTLRVDTVAPELTITPTVNGYVATGSDIHWYRQGANVSVSASAMDVTSGVSLILKDGAVYTAGVSDFLDTTAENNTTHAFFVLDIAGNSTAENFKYAMDGSAPEITDVIISNAYEVEADCYWVKLGDSVVISTAVTDSKSGVKEVTFGGTAAIGTDNAYSMTYPTTAEVVLSAYVIAAQDNVENSAETTVYIGVDGTAPVINDNAPDLVTPAISLPFVLNAVDPDGSGVKEATYSINGDTPVAYTPGSSLEIDENCSIEFVFRDIVGNESTAEYTVNNIVDIFGSDDHEITDKDIREETIQTVQEINAGIIANTIFNGTGSGAAGSSSVEDVLGPNGHISVKLVEIAFNEKADEVDGSESIISYTFEVTAFDSQGEEQHNLSGLVTFQLPIYNPDGYAFADIYHGSEFLMQVSLDRAATYIKVTSKDFSEYSYVLTNTSRYTAPANYSITVEESENGTVEVSKLSASAGTEIILTVKPDDGWTLETLTVKNAAGTEIELTNHEDGTYAFKMPSFAVTVTATFMEDNTMLNYFFDVKAPDYFYDAVLWAAENGITNGTEPNYFTPSGITTRAQMVTFLWRAAGEPVVNYAMPFTDVDENAYYAEAVRWAASEGIVKGMTETTFNPDVKVTRAQAVTMLWRHAGALQFANMTANGPAPSPFEDVATDAYYYSAVLWAKGQGITTGATDTTFEPNETCIRAQIVTFLYRYFVK